MQLLLASSPDTHTRTQSLAHLCEPMADMTKLAMRERCTRGGRAVIVSLPEAKSLIRDHRTSHWIHTLALGTDKTKHDTVGGRDTQSHKK